MRIRRFFPGNWLLISEAKNGVPEVRYGLKGCEVARLGIQRWCNEGQPGSEAETKRTHAILLLVKFDVSSSKVIFR
jgi:hypothetical protein